MQYSYLKPIHLLTFGDIRSFTVDHYEELISKSKCPKQIRFLLGQIEKLLKQKKMITEQELEKEANDYINANQIDPDLIPFVKAVFINGILRGAAIVLQKEIDKLRENNSELQN